jgi:CheY-like chemotaxis protein/HPt (histidine-containing phosphotransfer) domain-containing protein
MRIETPQAGMPATPDAGMTVGKLMERLNHFSTSINNITDTTANLRQTDLTQQQAEYIRQIEDNIAKLAEEMLQTNSDLKISYNSQSTGNEPVNENKISIEGVRVLLVEDDVIIRTIAINILKRAGADVTLAVNGQVATELSAIGKFDVILMDMQMPVMNGFDAARIIRFQQNRTTPIIALTANRIQDGEEQYFKAGMNDVMAKPYNQEKLVNIIHKWTKELNITDLHTKIFSETLDHSLFSLAKLRDIGDELFVNRMLQLFIDQVSPAATTIRQAYDQNDFHALRYTVHRIRPSILNMGINSLKTEIFEIEELAAANERSTKLDEMITRLESVMHEVTEQVRRLIA